MPKFIETRLWHWALPFESFGQVAPSGRRAIKTILRGTLNFRRSIPEGFSFCGPLSWRTPPPEQEFAQRQRLRALPRPADDAMFWEGLGTSIGDARAVRFHASRHNELRLWILAMRQGRPHVYARRAVSIANRTVMHEFFIVEKSARGSGVSLAMMANAYRVYSALAMKRISMVAGLSDGTAVWVRYGFQPSGTRDWKKARDTIKQNAAELDRTFLDAFRASRGIELETLVEDVISDPDPRAIFDIFLIDRDNFVEHSLGIKHGLPGLLLRGGRWHAHLDLCGDGGKRLATILRGRGYPI